MQFELCVLVFRISFCVGHALLLIPVQLHHEVNSCCVCGELRLLVLPWNKYNLILPAHTSGHKIAWLLWSRDAHYTENWNSRFSTYECVRYCNLSAKLHTVRSWYEEWFSNEGASCWAAMRSRGSETTTTKTFACKSFVMYISLVEDWCNKHFLISIEHTAADLSIFLWKWILASYTKPT